MLLTKNILAELILINEALRAGNQIQADQLSTLRESSEYHRSCLQALQRTKLYSDEATEAEGRRARNHYISERRQAGIPLQAGTYETPEEMVKRTQSVRRPSAQGIGLAKVPLQWQHDVVN